jgi:hypothetical protein
MPDTTTGNRGRGKQKIPRIESKDATRLFTQLEHLLDGSGDLVASLRRARFAQFLAQLPEQILQLAVQPDSWGERTRARLVSEIIAGLRGIPAESASVEEIVHISNIVMPCFLLELGRRKHHIEIEFPADPCDSGALFGFRAGPSHAVHSVTKEQLVELVTEAGEDLVGLCYFGGQQSRDSIEAELDRKNATANSKARPGRSSSSSPSKTTH